MSNIPQDRTFHGRAEPRRISLQDVFDKREVGYTHPDNGAYIRLNDAGDVELVSGPGCAIVISSQGDITFIADEIHLITKPGNSIRWNLYEFNEASTLYSQPTLLPYRVSDRHSIYGGFSDFMES